MTTAIDDPLVPVGEQFPVGRSDVPPLCWRFADDPLASDSAQFPLARPMGMPESVDPPSPDAIRPWGLRWMEVLPSTGQRITMWHYDHEHQVAVDSNGTPLSEIRMGAPTANKVTSNDGDEGPSEDFTYDFAPDTPFLLA